MSNSPPPSSSRFTFHVSRLRAQPPLGTPHLPSLLLALLIIAYALYFSWYTINRHNSLHSYAADLSLIDQPMWNTVRGPGGFMELTWGDHQQPRLAEHFEPILLPLALLFFLWNDVRILLIAQSIALALGALPVFWIARNQLKVEGSTLNVEPSTLPSWAALAFAATYLLSPHLQAANIADFHADPFVVTPLLFAFWYATQQRWGWMWVWAIVAMATKETLPTLTAMLGLWLWMTADRRPQTAAISALNPAVPRRRSAGIHGLGLILISAAWFLSATFLIVTPLARQYFGTAGPIYLTSRYTDTGLLALLQDPARWNYVLGLLAAVGFLPLLAPELLVLGLPVLLANLFSNFPGQYSGEQHYSAPLVVAFIIAAIYGTGRIINKMSLRENNGQSFKMTSLIYFSLWLLCWALGYHARFGWTPLSSRMESYAMSPAAARLPDFLAQIPDQAIVSASAAVHPHLAHRQVIYLFPTLQEADYLLVDVMDIPGVHPNDARAKILTLFDSDWRLLQAGQGLILAKKLPSTRPAPLLPPALGSSRGCSSALPLPCSFFTFVHPTTSPTHPTQLIFGDGQLRLLGYDIHDDPDNGPIFRFYWQALETLPENLQLWPLVYDDLGQLLSDPTQIPMIAPVWYPPALWQPGEIVVTETLPQLLPDLFNLGLAIGPEGSFADPARWFPITAAGEKILRFDSGQWVQLATFQRSGSILAGRPATLILASLNPAKAKFGSAIQLTGFRLDQTELQPGSSLPILLQWVAGQPPQTNYTVFLHLLAPDGRIVAQNDSYPTWLTPQPTSQWPLQQPMLDSHRLNLPPDLPGGSYTLQVGLYDAQTLRRLRLPDGADVFTLGQIQIR